MFGEGGKVFFGNENKYGHVLGPVLCLCGGAHLEGREEIFFPLACRPRAPSLSDAVGGLGTLSRLASWSSATSRAAAPRGAPFFFFWGAPWARLPFPPARYLRPHAEERRVQRWITKIWNPVTGALVTSLRLANIFPQKWWKRPKVLN
jgi:hypothetical protein